MHLKQQGKYRENKWTKMGGGDPTVLPLYHTCASEYYSDIKEQKQGIDVSLSLKENSNDQACKEAVRKQYISPLLFEACIY